MDRDILYRFFEGHVSIEEIEMIKKWVESSEENKKLLHQERKLFNAIVLTGSSKQKVTSKSMIIGKKYLIQEFLRIASAIIIAVSATITFFVIGNADSDISMAMQTITVPAGQRVNIDLPDGTNVWLNAGTKIQYPISFLNNKREVTLDGEAYFDVAHNKRCPFIVHTHVIDIEVLGTKFNVEAYSELQNFEASLMEGKIKMQSLSDENTSLVLSPHHKSILKGNKLVVSKIEDYNIYRWKEGLYCFKNKQFAEIIKDLERYYDLKIILNKPSLIPITLTGKFRISDGLDYALRVLQNDVSFIYERDKNNDVIYIK